MKNIVKGICLVGLGFSLVSCSNNKDIEVLETTVTVMESKAGETNFSVNDEIKVDNNDLRIVQYEDNDTGIKNPQSNFKQKFDITSDTRNMDGYNTGLPSNEELMKDMMGEDYDLMQRYMSNKSNLTNELIIEMHNHGIDYDSDSDGLLDYDEISEYHTDPNKKSTSGDVYSDGYKVKNGMDVTKQYDVDWVRVDDIVMMLPGDEDAFSCCSYDLYDNYLEESGSYNFRVAMYFSGDIRVDLSKLSLQNVVIEVFNEYDYTHTEIKYTILDGNIAQFHVDKGYNVYLIHDKSINVDSLLSVVLGSD